MADIGSAIKSAASNLRDRRTRARRRVEEIFSRDVLGSILVSLSISKIVETGLAIVAPTLFARLVGWIVLSVLFVAIFVYWERVAFAAKQAAEGAAEKADGSQ